jgi:putative flippase GtrA
MNLLCLDKLNSIKEIKKFKTFLKFSFSSGVGVFINLSLTLLLTEFLFGRQNYFYAYVISLTIGLLAQFILHIKYTFKKSNHISQKFQLFMGYSVIMTLIQVVTVRAITGFLGVNYYIFVISFVICFFYISNYLINKTYIFN